MGLAKNELFEPLVAGLFARSRVRAQDRAGTARATSHIENPSKREEAPGLGVSHGNPLMNILKGRSPLFSLSPLLASTSSRRENSVARAAAPATRVQTRVPLAITRRLGAHRVSQTRHTFLIRLGFDAKA